MVQSDVSLSPIFYDLRPGHTRVSVDLFPHTFNRIDPIASSYRSNRPDMTLGYVTDASRRLRTHEATSRKNMNAYINRIIGKY
jgi:hypothetical protein